MAEECVFCRIAAGEEPCHRIWEDENHLAFLSHRPNTEGFSVVITKEHHPSYAFEVPDDILVGLVLASREVGRLLDAAFDDVGRTGMILEGFGVDHLHSKLFPMHGTAMEAWEPIHSDVDRVFEEYEGYISSHDGPKGPEKGLKKLAVRLREVG